MRLTSALNHNQINIGSGTLFGIKISIQGEMIRNGVMAIEIKKEATGFASVVLVSAILIGDVLCAPMGSGNNQHRSTVIFEGTQGLKGNGMV